MKCRPGLRRTFFHGRRRTAALPGDPRQAVRRLNGGLHHIVHQILRRGLNGLLPTLFLNEALHRIIGSLFYQGPVLHGDTAARRRALPPRPPPPPPSLPPPPPPPAPPPPPPPPPAPPPPPPPP